MTQVKNNFSVHVHRENLITFMMHFSLRKNDILL